MSTSLSSCGITFSWHNNKTSDPPGLEGFSSCVSSDSQTLFIFGGADPPTGQESNQLYSFSFKKGWTKELTSASDDKKGVPIGRLGAAMVGDHSKIYLFGGCSMSASSGWLNDLWCLDINSMKWTKIESENAPCARDKTSLSCIGRKLYLYGGFGPSVNLSHVQPVDDQFSQIQFHYFTDFFEFDLDSYIWTKITVGKSHAPDNLAAHGQAVLGSRLILFGGKDGEKRINRVFVFDTEKKNWENHRMLKDAPEGRSFHSVCALDNSHLVISGGRNNDNEELDDIQIYDIDLQKWVEPLITNQSDVGCRFGHVIACLNDDNQRFLIMFGGNSDFDADTGLAGKIHNQIAFTSADDLLKLVS